ncbi:TPA: hypothetical protein N0F65_008630 [Lagenidium giganteum]|uniref:Uncharacterized protein n=1 Tax=Lagenidium giganteum TaxID=4803 RepID=A0AAV2YYW0_9STRA|nr:TPA: hypothetical protein N0F65_008630 [Lagenidium giganteum]
MEILDRHLKRAEPGYRFVQGKKYETHFFYNDTQKSVIDKIKTIVSSKTKAFKANIYLDYVLVNRQTGEEMAFTEGFNTNVFKKPVFINSRADIQDRIIDYFSQEDLLSKISFPSSAWMVKKITGFQIKLYNRSHTLGAEIEIPKKIKENKYIVSNFGDTENKCVFYCLAYYFKMLEHTS